MTWKMTDEQREQMGQAFIRTEMGDPEYRGLNEVEIAVRLGIVAPLTVCPGEDMRECGLGANTETEKEK